jgi:hypothetical protein
MWKLWEDHVTWTRLVIVDVTFGTADTGPTVHRLLRNQVDIGNAVMPFYGAAAGHRLTALLLVHIELAANILVDFKAGDTSGVQQNATAWYANANQIAAFLHSLNPRHWSLDALQDMMKMHLDLTLKEAVAELTGHYEASIDIYNAVVHEILRMANTLSLGIIAQFPGKFVGPIPTHSAPDSKISTVAFHDAMRKLWEDHVTFTRLAIVDVQFGTADTGPTVARLLHNQVAIGNAVKPFYGDAAGSRLTALLMVHIVLAANILVDFKAGDTTGVQQNATAWYANANRIAAFLHSLNPRHWSLDALQDMMKMHLDLTLKEGVAELTAHYGLSIATYGMVVHEILNMADTLSAGIIAQFPEMFAGPHVM